MLSKYRDHHKKNQAYIVFFIISASVYLIWGILTPTYFVDGPAIDGIALRSPGAIIPMIGLILYWFKGDQAPTQLLFDLSFFGFLCSFTLLVHYNNYHQIYVLGSFIIQAGANSLIDKEKLLIGYNILNLILALAIFTSPAPAVNPYFYLTSVVTLGGLLCVTTILKLRAQRENYALEERLAQEESQRIVFGGLAHEVNNPLMILLGLTNRMEKILLKNQAQNSEVDQKEQLYEFVKEKLAVMTDSISRISDIISDLRRTAYGDHVLKLVNINLRAIIETIIKEENTERSRKFRINETENLIIKFDEASLRKILSELIKNSIHYSKEMIQIDITSNKVIITNDGDKIPTEIADKIFDPFFTTKDIGKGKGLGLSVAKGLAAQNSSTIILKENLDQSVTFELIFMIDPAN